MTVYLGGVTKVWRRVRDTYRHPSLKLVRRLIVAVVGGTVLLIGVAMILLPGPAVLVIPLGLAILGTEFLWAKHLLRKAKDFVGRHRKKGNGVVKENATPASEVRDSKFEVRR